MVSQMEEDSSAVKADGSNVSLEMEKAKKAMSQLVS